MKKPARGRLKEPRLGANEFVAEAYVSLPREEALKLDGWLNRQHTGKSVVPISSVVSTAHLEAANNLHRSRRCWIKFRVDKTGNWKCLGIER